MNPQEGQIYIGARQTYAFVAVKVLSAPDPQASDPRVLVAEVWASTPDSPGARRLMSLGEFRDAMVPAELAEVFVRSD